MSNFTYNTPIGAASGMINSVGINRAQPSPVAVPVKPASPAPAKINHSVWITIDNSTQFGAENDRVWAYLEVNGFPLVELKQSRCKVHSMKLKDLLSRKDIAFTLYNDGKDVVWKDIVSRNKDYLKSICPNLTIVDEVPILDGCVYDESYATFKRGKNGIVESFVACYEVDKTYYIVQSSLQLNPKPKDTLLPLRSNSIHYVYRELTHIKLVSYLTDGDTKVSRNLSKERGAYGDFIFTGNSNDDIVNSIYNNLINHFGAKPKNIIWLG